MQTASLPPHLSEVLTPSQLERRIDALLRHLPPDTAPIAVFDADETLWHCDVGEDLFQWFVQEELVHPSISEKVCRALDHFNIPHQGSAVKGLHAFLAGYSAGHYSTQLSVEQILFGYELMVWCMGGHPVETLDAWASARIPELLEGRIFEQQLQWIERLAAVGITSYIVSASNLWSVRAGARFIGFPLEQVRAVRLRCEDGRALPEFEHPVPIDAGKPLVVKTLLDSTSTGSPQSAMRPLIGFGDSRFDVPMLRGVHFPVLVNHKPSALDAAAQYPEVPWNRVALQSRR